jgi:hypothetical protein
MNLFAQRISWRRATLATAFAIGFVATTASASPTNTQPTASTRSPIPSVAQSPDLKMAKKPDLIAENAGSQFLFRVRNVGAANSPASVARVMCYTNVAGPPSERCAEGTHFVVLPGVVLPPGTTKAGGNVWNVPIGGLDAVTGFTTFSLNIKTVPALQAQGLRFQVCADGPSAIAESNEGNNCQWFVHNWPN